MSMDKRNHQSQPQEPEETSKPSKFKRFQFDPQLLQIKNILIQINIWEDPSVQRDFNVAKYGTPQSRERAMSRLVARIQNYEELFVDNQDAFMPYATEEQISNKRKGIHILDQVHNDIPLYLDETTLLLKGLMVIGRPGYGKSSAVYNISNQTTTPYLGLDPKAAWKQASVALNAKYFRWNDVYFCLRPPKGITWEDWLFIISDIISQATGLQYSQDLIVEAGQICLRQKKDYENNTDIETSISLKDLRLALNLCSAKNYKRTQYLESAKTALNLLIGSENQHIFAARSGLPLDEIRKGKYFIGLEYANSYQSRFFGLYYFQHSRYSVIGTETHQLQHFTMVDDAGRFLSQTSNIFGTGGQYGPWMDLLKVLRTSGDGYLFVDQLCSPQLREIKQLVNCWLVIGSIGQKDELDAISAVMNLSPEQRNMLTKFKQRECVFFCPEIGRPIHGLIPLVDRPC